MGYGRKCMYYLQGLLHPIALDKDQEHKLTTGRCRSGFLGDGWGERSGYTAPIFLLQSSRMAFRNFLLEERHWISVAVRHCWMQITSGGVHFALCRWLERNHRAGHPAWEGSQARLSLMRECTAAAPTAALRKRASAFGSRAVRTSYQTRPVSSFSFPECSSCHLAAG